MSDEFKWQAVGLHQVISDKDTGRVLAHILANDKAQKLAAAFIDGKSIGYYLSEKFAREAVEVELTMLREGLGRYFSEWRRPSQP